MHNRDLIWKTADGRKIKLREMSSAHLSNAYQFLLDRIDAYYDIYGKKRIKILKDSMQQELRLRKLNRIKIDNEDQLF